MAPDDERILLRIGEGPIAWKLCRCHRCGVTRRCTPENDFYAYPKCEEGWLYCERCILAVHGGFDEVIAFKIDTGTTPEDDEEVQWTDTEEDDDPADWWKKT